MVKGGCIYLFGLCTHWFQVVRNVWAFRFTMNVVCSLNICCISSTDYVPSVFCKCDTFWPAFRAPVFYRKHSFCIKLIPERGCFCPENLHILAQLHMCHNNYNPILYRYANCKKGGKKNQFGSLLNLIHNFMILSSLCYCCWISI